MERHARLNITLPESIADELTSLADELKDKKSHIIAKALEIYFDEMDTAIAEKRIRELTEGNETVVPSDKVWEELGI